MHIFDRPLLIAYETICNIIIELSIRFIEVYDQPKTHLVKSLIFKGNKSIKLNHFVRPTTQLIINLKFTYM